MYYYYLQAVSNRETEVQTEDEQAFLARQQEILKQGDQVRGESPLRSQGVGSNKSGPRTPGTAGQSSPKKVGVMNKLNNTSFLKPICFIFRLIPS